MHRAAHDGGGSVSRLVLSSRRAAAEFDAWAGESRCCARMRGGGSARGKRPARSGVGERARAGATCSLWRASGDCRFGAAELCARLVAHREAGEYWAALDISGALRADQGAGAAHCGLVRYLSRGIDRRLSGAAQSGGERVRARAPISGCRAVGASSRGAIAWARRILGDAANLDTDALLLRWFDHWLKDSGNSTSEPRVRYFALGANEWRDCGGVAGGSRYRAVPAQRGQCEFAQGRWDAGADAPPEATSRAMCLSTTLRCRCLRRAGRRR